jgi:hypothetical protein
MCYFILMYTECVADSIWPGFVFSLRGATQTLKVARYDCGVKAHLP